MTLLHSLRTWAQPPSVRPCHRFVPLSKLILIISYLVVHPLVLLSVADHHARSAARAGSNRRVVGVLLGQDNGKTVNVANSFAIPFEEDEKDSKTWFLDHNYIEGMWEMFKKVNGKYHIYMIWLLNA